MYQPRRNVRRALLAGALIGGAVGAELHTAAVQAATPVEQIEAPEQEVGDAPNMPTGYAPVNFNGSSTVVSGGITYHALAGLTNTGSAHAAAVAGNFYGSGTPGGAFTTTVYDDDADYFFGDVDPQPSVGVGAIPGNFAGGSKVINNSYIADGSGAEPAFSDVDAYRRIDYMIATDDVTFVTAAVSQLTDSNNVTTNYALNWSAYNSLAVTGDEQVFSPANYPGGAPGKAHADLFGGPGDASFSTAAVSSYAQGLYGNAEAAGQTDAQHGIVVRSLLMAGADKSSYTGPYTANHLSVQNGAGTADYTTSLAILRGGERTIVDGQSNTTIINPPTSTSAAGWAYGYVNGNSDHDYIFIHSDSPISAITASLNWNVTQTVDASNDSIDTSSSQFPDVGLELVPVTNIGNNVMVIGGQTESALISVLPENTDNEQFLSFTGSLPAGDYAFEFIGDPSASLGTDVGFSYAITEVPEPGSLAGAALVAGWCLRRRRRIV